MTTSMLLAGPRRGNTFELQPDDRAYDPSSPRRLASRLHLPCSAGCSARDRGGRQLMGRLHAGDALFAAADQPDLSRKRRSRCSRQMAAASQCQLHAAEW